MKLIIVESPAKSKTIGQFLGKEYRVVASMGHIRDLPKNKLGIDIENNFKPEYIIPDKSKKIIQMLKNESEKSSMVILATDEDREGEAIAWHLIQVLGLNNIRNQKSEIRNYQRITFHEITKEAIQNSLKHPRDIDINLVDAQQARRILDRIVGYKLSPFLWKKVARRLSAGRVQSVAVRLVVEREREIQDFIPQEYWEIVALCKSKKDKDNKSFSAKLIKKEGKVIPKLGIKSKETAEKIVKELKDKTYKIISIENKEVKRNPFPPFITSTLQQEAWRKFHWPAKFTMRIAQHLYEKGYSTYHRTDSLHLSNLSLLTAKKFIINQYGKQYWAGYLRQFKTKSKSAQEAHEAIRPTYPNNTPFMVRNKNKLDESQIKLYELIWQRFIASQMAQAVFDSSIVDIGAGHYVFRANGQVLKFDGFLKVYPIQYEEAILPHLKKNEILELIRITPSQHFTQPPPRYNEATLIKVLEENGIGRPSTYAPILSTVQERNYIEKDEKKRFLPTEIGIVVNDLLVKHFPKIVDVKFTAKMEESLDKIAEGKKKWTRVIQEFYEPFNKNLQKKYQEVSKSDITVRQTKKICPKCGAPLLIRLGKFGKFYACSRFPKCTYTASLKENRLEVRCPKCGGEIVKKRTKKGKIFYACSNWPKCDFASWDKPTGETCPRCGSYLVYWRNLSPVRLLFGGNEKKAD